jgi:opacity protein-like surface antigen
MKGFSKLFTTCFVAIAAFANSYIYAGTDSSKEIITKPAPVEEELFVEDRITTQLVTGVLFSPVGIGPDHESFDYEQTNLRLGWMLNTPSPDGGFFRGNFEAIAELSGSAIFDGWGNVMVGPTFLVRYNFVQPEWKVVPYVQVGAGFVYTDAYENMNQTVIGQAWEFTPQASVGLKYLLGNNWSLDAEFMYHHVSNASMADRNGGINSLGGLVGVT